MLAWFLGIWLGIAPPLLWYLRGGLWLIGCAGLWGFHVLRSETGADETFASSASDIDAAFKAASKLLRAAKEISAINSLPAVFLLGDTGTGKTSTLTKSGLAPEMMAETRTCNIWYARKTIFIDPAGSLMKDAAARRKLFRKFLPLRVQNKSPARAAVLVVDCDSFLKAGKVSGMPGKAREYNAILGELSKDLGCSLPVYVLFSKTDKVRYFKDFVENLSEAEAGEVLGLSLPLQSRETQTVYLDRQVHRLADAFKSISHALADRRRLYLAREQDPDKLANIYEFPREFSKLRPLMVEFLVDVGLRSESRSGESPFLRGFYFTGERETNPGQPAKPVYMQRLFSDVFLADRVGSQMAKPRARRLFALKLLLASLTAVSLFAAGRLTVSYLRNNALVEDGVEATRPASADSLERLSHLRDILSTLNAYEKTGPPWQYAALLYKGHDVREPLRSVYFAMFRRMLLEPTQQTLLKICADPNAYSAHGYDYVFKALKTYLITTAHPEQNSGFPLTAMLVRYWRNDRPVSAERENMARKNFAFYAEALAAANTYSRFSQPDSAAVASARTYLNSFAQPERIYRSMLLDAAGQQKALIFNEDYPVSADIVINSFRVEPWFRKTAYLNFQTELANLDNYLKAEDWVLGRKPLDSSERAELSDALRSRFESEFVDAWSGYLKATSVVRYKNVSDAVYKLRNLGSPDSALLLNLCVASENTAVEASNVKEAFQPVQAIAPPGCLKQSSSGTASDYLESLNSLANALAAVGAQANAEDLRQAAGMTRAADTAANQLSAALPSGPADTAVLVKTAQLLKDPILRVPELLKAKPAPPKK